MAVIAPLLMLASAAADQYGPATPPPPTKATESRSRDADPCVTRNRKAEAQEREIVICAPKVEGYRIDPEILEARRDYRGPGGPKPPERLRNNDCATVGPMGCRGGVAFDFLAAAMVLGKMVDRAVKGENWAEPLIRKSPSEYELYKAAKQRREAREAEQAAARAKNARRAQAAGDE